MNKPTSSPSATPSSLPTQDEIAHRAREIWRARGEPANQDLEIWIEAEKQLRSPPAKTERAASSTGADSSAVDPRAQGVVKRRRSRKSLSAKVDETLRGRPGVGQGGNAPIDPTT